MKYSKLPLTAIFLLLTMVTLQAQETVATTGSEATGNGGSSSYTVGQLVYTTYTGANGSVAQGVQQPFEISISLGAEETKINLELAAYPNPTTNLLTLSIGNFENEKLTYQLYDMQGKVIENNQITNTKTTLHMEKLAAGTYFLSVLDTNSILKTFRIIKN